MMRYLLPFCVCISLLWAADMTNENPQFPADKYLKIVTIFTNDIHGGIDRSEASFINPDFPPMLGGGAVAGRYIMLKRAEARKKDWAFLLIDAGDFYQGTPLGTLSEGEAVIQYMNTVGYDVLTVGNHDFDHGWKNLKHLAEIADFPFLAANLYRESTGELVDFVEPYIIKEFQGIKVGIIGATISTTPSMSFPEHVEDLKFQNEVTALRKYLPEVKKQGVNFIIFLTHSWLAYDPQAGYREMLEKVRKGETLTDYGSSAQEIAHRVAGIDVIFSGHLHKGFYEPWEDPTHHTLIFQNYANGGNLGHVNFYVHRQTGTLAGYDYVSDDGAIFTLFEDDFWPDPDIAKQIDAWVAKAEAGFDEVIGKTTGLLMRANQGESPLGNLVVDAMRSAVRADVSFSNYGGVRADINSGPITPRMVFDVMPFGNRIVVINISGELLKKLVEDRVRGTSRGMLVGGARLVIDRRKPDGSRVVEFSIDGQALAADRSYRLAVSDYLAEGNSGYERLTEIPASEMNPTGILVRRAIIDYIKAHSPIKPHTDGRWQEISE